MLRHGRVYYLQTREEILPNLLLRAAQFLEVLYSLSYAVHNPYTCQDSSAQYLARFRSSRLRIGKLTRYTVTYLRHLRDFFGVYFRLKADPQTSTVSKKYCACWKLIGVWYHTSPAFIVLTSWTWVAALHQTERNESSSPSKGPRARHEQHWNLCPSNI